MRYRPVTVVDGVTGRLPSSTAVTGLRNRVLNGSPDLAHTQAAPLEAVVHRRAHGAVRQRRGRIVCARPCCSRCSLPARPASPARHDGRVRTARPAPRTPARATCPTRPACPAPPVPSACGTAPCASASARAHAPAHLRGTGRAHPPSSAPDAARVRVPRRVPQRCGADRGPAVLRSAVSHRHDGELDYHSDAAPNPGRQARPALGFAAPAWALSVGTGGLGHARSFLAHAAC